MKLVSGNPPTHVLYGIRIMKIKKQHGIVAILDALGASSYNNQQIEVFLRSRDNVLELLNEKIEGMRGRIDHKDIEIFTFNDTILIAYKTGDKQPNLRIIERFFSILRKFFVDSLSHCILFRGSVAIGSFYVDNNSNTVMGQAVTDAAAWYEQADWIGIQATPRATIIVQQWLEKENLKRIHLMLDYDVPLKNHKSVHVKAVNWPKAFFIESITPCDNDEEPRKKLHQLLSLHDVPLGTERTFFNTIEFFDYAANIMKK